jgi:prevent-host-death family protein
MRSISAQNAKNNFGELIDLARAAPIAVTKYDRRVVVVMAVEEYDRLTELARGPGPAGAATKAAGRSRKTTGR